MQKRPITIALAVAGIIAGTAGIAAVNSEGIEKVSEPLAVQTEAQAPVVTADATARPQILALAPATEPVNVKPGNAVDEKVVRIPFTDVYVTVRNPTFPRGADEHPAMLPSVVAYFDTVDAQRLAAATARERVTAYVESLSQKLASAPAAPIVATESPVTAMSLAPGVRSDVIKSATLLPGN